MHNDKLFMEIKVTTYELIKLNQEHMRTHGHIKPI
jgi:hypothetical protein